MGLKMATFKGDSAVMELAAELAELTPGQRYHIADLTATLSRARAKTAAQPAAQSVCPLAQAGIYPSQAG